MLWSLPAVLQIDWAQAREMLIYAFTTQLANIGVRSRFIDGIVLEPGRQLDHLCAPVRALHNYVALTGDMSVLFDRRVQTGVNTIQQILAAQRHPQVPLFETLLLPSGEPSRYPYVCYSNVLVWRVLLDVGSLYDRIRDVDRADESNALAEQVKAAIISHFIVPGPSGDIFARGIDLQGGYELGDDPSGSLKLLAYYGICFPDDLVYKNTLTWIDSQSGAEAGTDGPAAGCEAEGSVVSVINDLLIGRKDEALGFLKESLLDDGIACESVDHHTGRAVSGKASASCAGYLAFALRHTLDAAPPLAATAGRKIEPSETLYQPPPETSHDTKKARL